MKGNRSHASSSRGGRNSRRDNGKNKKIVIAVVIAILVVIGIIVFGTLPKAKSLPIENQVVRSVNSDGSIVLSNGLTVELLGVKPDARTINFLQSNVVGKAVRVIADSKDENATYTDPNKDRVRGYVTVMGSTAFTNLNGYLLKEKLASLNASYCQDSLQVYRAYANGESVGAAGEVATKNGDLPYDISKTYSEKELYKLMAPRTMYIEVRIDDEHAWSGTAFFIDGNGHALTNWHVLPDVRDQGYDIERYAKVYICDEKGNTSMDRSRKIGRIIASSKSEDWCIFSVQLDANEKSPYMALAKKEPEVGEHICVLGNPDGIIGDQRPGSVTNVVTPHDIMVSSGFSHGNSGGPVYNMHGEVIGIAQGVYDDGAGKQNVAVDIQLVRKHMRDEDMRDIPNFVKK